MKIKHVWSVLCKESIIDQNSKLISLLNTLEEVTIQTQSEELLKKTNIFTSYEIVSLWHTNEKQVTRGKIKYVLTDSNKKKLFEKTQPLEVKDKAKRLRTRMKINGLPVTKAGEYLFTIRIKEEGSKYRQVSQIPLEVKFK